MGAYLKVGKQLAKTFKNTFMFAPKINKGYSSTA